MAATLIIVCATPTMAAPYELTVWGEREPGKLNISLFTFRDENRNGEYDVGDLPMAGVVMNFTEKAGRAISFRKFSLAKDTTLMGVL